MDYALGVGGFPAVALPKFLVRNHRERPLGTAHHRRSPEERRVGAFIDAEHALDPNYAKNLGVDLDNLLISQPDTGEQALEIAETLVRSGPWM